MHSKDPHTLSFNLSNSVGSTTIIPILFPQDYEVWALHFEDYMLGLEDHGMLIWEAITQQTFSHTGTRRIIKTQVDYHALLLEVTNVSQD